MKFYKFSDPIDSEGFKKSFEEKFKKEFKNHSIPEIDKLENQFCYIEAIDAYCFVDVNGAYNLNSHCTSGVVRVNSHFFVADFLTKGDFCWYINRQREIEIKLYDTLESN